MVWATSERLVNIGVEMGLRGRGAGVTIAGPYDDRELPAGHARLLDRNSTYPYPDPQLHPLSSQTLFESR